MMAALGAALVLRLPLAAAVQALCSYQPAPHRCERVAEFEGVQFVNDSKATNVDAVRQALLAMPAPEDGRANLWLIAGGKDKGFSYGELGPVLASRVRGAFVLGETGPRICGEWQRFTPCTSVKSLLEAVDKAGRQARQGDVILLSPACSSFDMFQNYQHRGEIFRQAVLDWIRQRTKCPQEIGAGAREARP
jgi:UDP-N-acetylmuramoylalanine--D-glutamate ligase